MAADVLRKQYISIAAAMKTNVKNAIAAAGHQIVIPVQTVAIPAIRSQAVVWAVLPAHADTAAVVTGIAAILYADCSARTRP